MLYQAVIVVPPNTSERYPIRTTINPTVGVLKGVDIYFRDGCLDAVGVRILERDRQIAPLPAGWIKDNNRHVEWSESKRLEGGGYQLTVECYSLALDWPHTIDVRFYMDMD